MEGQSHPASPALVSSRKYRPACFAEVLSQEHVSTTLKNAILQDRLSHAYLFAGPRGVGKTTMARILAKAVNCEARQGPEPCDKCSMCEEIRQGRALDVIEIDGASNRRIGDVRDLRQKVGIAPSRARRKVYIIDEVHMLTNEAFNALLKTLEEPPDRVIFIFATTEPHKVPLTIVSRCQRFDFRSIPKADIAGYLKSVAKKEAVELGDDTIYAIARKADGSLRDALSLFDQIRAFSGGAFEENDVFIVTGMIEEDVYLEILKAIADGDGKRVVDVVNRIWNSGIDLGEFYDGLLEHFRNLIVLKVDDSLAGTCDVSGSSIDEYLKLAPRFDIRELHGMFDRLAESRVSFRNSDLKRILLESILLKFTWFGKRSGGSSNKDHVSHESIPEKQTPDQPDDQVGSKPVTGDDESVWNSFLDVIRSRKVTLCRLPARARWVSRADDYCAIGMEFNTSFVKDQLLLPGHVSLINQCLAEVGGKNVHFDIQYGMKQSHPTGKTDPSGVHSDTMIESFKKILDAEEVPSSTRQGT